MVTAAISKAQIGVIHTLAKRAGMDDDTYRDFLERETGRRSSKALNGAQARAVIDRLKALSTPSQIVANDNLNRPSANGAMRLSGRYAAICRALWLSAFNLGLVLDRSDRAMVAFVKRQTGIDHLDWVKDGADAARVIEALKKWTAREAGVEWDKPAAELRALGLSIGRWRKIAVVQAQCARLVGLGLGDVEIAFEDFTDAGLDEIAKDLGARLRRARGGR